VIYKAHEIKSVNPFQNDKVQRGGGFMQNSASKRKSWDDYFMDIAKMVATMSTCDRARVGAVIVRDNRILATGYNDTLPGEPNCEDVGHLMVDDEHCQRTIHAARNAIAQCYQMGLNPKGATIYVTHSPCLICRRLIDEACIDRIVYDQEYNEARFESRFGKEGK
jgi:dCMP deaminase